MYQSACLLAALLPAVLTENVPCVNTVAGSTSLSLFRSPQYLAIDPDGAVVFTAADNFTYRLVDDGSTVYAIAGTSASDAGLFGPGASVVLRSPLGIASMPNSAPADLNGSLVIADSDNNLLRLLSHDGMMSPLAGCAAASCSNSALQSGPATSAVLRSPAGVAINASGAVFFSDAGNNVIRVVVGGVTGVISTIAGNSSAGFWGDGGSAGLAMISNPGSLVLDLAGGLIFADTGNVRLRRIDLATGDIAAFAGTGRVGLNGTGTFAPDGALATETDLPSGRSVVLAVRPWDGGIAYADFNFHVVRVFVGGRVWTIAGSGASGVTNGDAMHAMFRSPVSLVFRPNGDLVVADALTQSLRLVSNATSVVTTLVSAQQFVRMNISGDTLAVSANFSGPMWLLHINESVLVVDQGASQVFIVNSNVTINRFAGTGAICRDATSACGDGGPALEASFTNPHSAAILPNNDIVVGDAGNNRIRLISHSSGLVSTLIGSGIAGYSPDSTPAIQVSMNTWRSSVCAITVDPSTGEVLYSDYDNFVVRRLLNGAGTVVTVAGASGKLGRPPTTPSALVGTPIGPINGFAWALNSSVLYASDSTFSVIYAFNFSSNTLTIAVGRPYSYQDARPVCTVMANGSFEPRYPEIGDGQPAINASLNSPIGLAVSSLSGALFFTDASDMLLRMVDANGTIWTVAGVWQKSQTSYYDFNAFAVQPSGDGVNVSNTTTFAGPYSVAIDATDNVFVSEGASRRIRELNYGQTLSCPAGYSCPCGLRPIPCAYPTNFSPPWALAAFNTSLGYYAVGSTSIVSPTGVVFYKQAPCPTGGFCSGGILQPCPAGTFGSAPAQPTVSACHVCPAETYSARQGASATALTDPCVVCPPGSASSTSGASFCPWVHLDCGKDSIGFPGPFNGCLDVLWDSEEPVPASHVSNGGADVDAELPPALFIVTEAILPDGSATTAWKHGSLRLRWYCCCPSRWASAENPMALKGVPACARHFLACGQRVRALMSRFEKRLLSPFLRTLDQMGDWKIGQASMSRPVHWEGTAFGGAMSLIAMSLTFAFCAVVTTQFFGPENQIVSKFVLPALDSSLSRYEGFSWTVLKEGPQWMPELSSGLRIEVALQGPDCGSILVDGNVFSPYNATIDPQDADSWLFVHAVECTSSTSCEFSPLSHVSVTFNGSCHSAAILVGSVGAQGVVRLAGRLLEPPIGQYLAIANVTITPAVEIFDNTSMAAEGVRSLSVYKQRGLLATVSASSLELSQLPPDQLVLNFALSASQTFSGTQIEPKFLVVDLVYQLLACFAFGLFLTYVYVWCMERYKRAVLGSEIASPHNRPSTLALLWAVCFPGRKIHELAGHSAGRAGGGKSGRSPRNVRPTVFLMPNLVKDGPAALGEAPDGDRVSATSGSGGGISIASPLVPGHGAVDWVGRPPLAPAAGAHAVSAELPLWAAANASGRSQSVPLALPTVSQTANDSEVGRLAHA